MLTAQSPVTGNHLLRPNTGRRPLQPIKSPANVPPPLVDHSHQKPNLKLGWIEDSNKENPNQNEKRNRSSICSVAAVPVQIEQFEVSLAEELSAIREKMERLRLDKEKTEKMLREREVMMEMKMKDLDHRGQIQKVLEMEVDRLYRLNELRSLCNRILPIRSLREKEQEKIKPDKSQGGKSEHLEEEKMGNPCGVIEK
ncbi:high mobility group B protein 6 [Cynara cardunculus var. scolymus]|uniref:high mobility group B protein 6 n=1 Tax=Cynara cardunculus var. scolymus TaxID=59895 RepID=UPI000D6298CE|nr:high mobility group B protein 6 [Cynara cardunculus var. scolymus]